MKKLLTTLCAAAFAGTLSAAEVDISNVDLNSSNASNADISTYYKWVTPREGDPSTQDVIASNATINYTESDLALVANRSARDFTGGTINLAAGTTNNFLYVGSTSSARNVLGFSNTVINGGDTSSQLTLSGYSDGTYNAGYFRMIPSSGANLAINKAQVTLTDVDIYYKSVKNATIAVNEGGVLNYNIGSLYNVSYEVDTTLGVTFASNDGTGKVSFGDSAFLNNITFNNIQIDYADGASFSGTTTVSGMRWTLDRNVSFEKLVTGEIVAVKGSNATMSLAGGSIANVELNGNTLEITGDVTSSQRVSGGNLTIAAGATFTSKNNANNINSLNMGAGSTFTAASAGVGGVTLRGNSSIDGSLIIAGGRGSGIDADTYTFAILNVKTTFGANASVDQQKYSDVQGAWVSGANANVSSSSAAGALKFANIVQLGGGATLNLNSTDAWISGYASEAGSATSQGGSTFAIVDHLSPTGATSATINVNATNNIGKFDLINNSKLQVNVNSGVFTLNDVSASATMSAKVANGASFVFNGATNTQISSLVVENGGSFKFANTSNNLYIWGVSSVYAASGREVDFGSTVRVADMTMAGDSAETIKARKIIITKGGKLKLDTENVIVKTGYVKDGKADVSHLASCFDNTTLELGANQAFGILDIAPATGLDKTVLTIIFNGNTLSFDSVSGTDTKDYQLNFEEFTSGNFVYTGDDTSVFDLSKILVNGKYTGDQLSWAGSAGNWSLTYNIPEPATYAAIFGGLALALAAYRRRK